MAFSGTGKNGKASTNGLPPVVIIFLGVFCSLAATVLLAMRWAGIQPEVLFAAGCGLGSLGLILVMGGLWNQSAWRAMAAGAVTLLVLAGLVVAPSLFQAGAGIASTGERPPVAPLSAPPANSLPERQPAVAVTRLSESRSAAARIPGAPQPGEPGPAQALAEYPARSADLEQLILAKRRFHRLGLDWAIQQQTLPLEQEKEIADFVDDFLVAWFPLGNDERESFRDLAMRGAILTGRADPGDDPLLMAMTIAAQARLDDFPISPDIQQQLLTAFDSYLGPRQVAASAIHFFTEAAARDNKRTGNHFVGPLTEQKLLTAWLTSDFRGDELEQRVALELVDSWFETCLGELGRTQPERLPSGLLESLASADQLPVWFREALLAEGHCRLAWKTRGGTAIGEVAEEKQAAFARQLEAAERHARAAFEANPWAPEPAVIMMQCAGSGFSAADLREWFEKAIAAQPDYFPAWDSMANFLKPRWGGQPAELTEFAIACVDTGRFNSAIPNLLFVALQDYLATHPDPESSSHQAVFGNAGLFDAMKRCVQGYVDEADRKFGPDSAASLRYQSLAAMFTYWFGDRQEALRALHALGDRLDVAAACLASPSLNPAATISLWEAENGMQAALATRLHQQFAERPPAAWVKDGKAPEMLDEIAAAFHDATDAEKDYWNSCEERLRIAQSYAAGQWTELPFDPALALWEGHNYAAIHSEDREIARFDTRKTAQKFAFLAFWDLFSGPKVMEVSFRFDDPEDRHMLVQAGLAFTRSRMEAVTDCPVAYFSHGLDQLNGGALNRMVPRRNSVFWYRLAGFAPDQTLRLRMQVADGHCQIFADGVLLLEDRSEGINAGNRLVLGTVPSLMRATVFEFRKLRIKQWRTGPCPSGMERRDPDTVAARESWLRDSAAEFPEFPWYQQQIAVIQFNAGEVDAALKAAEAANRNGLPGPYTALFRAHPLETAGKLDEALQLYRQAFAEPVAGTRLLKESRPDLPDAAELARLRYLWLAGAVGEETVAQEQLWTEAPPVEPWILARIEAAVETSSGERFRSACRRLQKVESTVPARWAEAFRKQLDCYQRNERYRAAGDDAGFVISEMPQVAPDSRLYTEVDYVR